MTRLRMLGRAVKVLLLTSAMVPCPAAKEVKRERIKTLESAEAFISCLRVVFMWLGLRVLIRQKACEQAHEHGVNKLSELFLNFYLLKLRFQLSC